MAAPRKHVPPFLSIVIPLLVGAVGAFLVVVPWTSWWDANYLLDPHPAVRGFLLSAFTRGAASGLGLVNILLALHDTHEHLTGAGDRG